MAEQKNLLNDEEIRKLITARLSVLSADTMIFVGSDGSFSRDELIERSGLKPAEVLSMISVLECSELIRDVEGKGYIRIKTHD